MKIDWMWLAIIMKTILKKTFNYIFNPVKYSVGNISALFLANVLYTFGFLMSFSTGPELVVYYFLITLAMLILPKVLSDVDQKYFRWFYVGLILVSVTLHWSCSYYNISKNIKQEAINTKIQEDLIVSKNKTQDSIIFVYKNSQKYSDSIKLFATVDTFLNNHELGVVKMNVEHKNVELIRTTYNIDIPSRSRISCEESNNCDSVIRATCENISTPFISSSLNISIGFDFDKYNKCIESVKISEEYNPYDTLILDTTYADAFVGLDELTNVKTYLDDSIFIINPTTHIRFNEPYQDGVIIKFKNSHWIDYTKTWNTSSRTSKLFR